MQIDWAALSAGAGSLSSRSLSKRRVFITRRRPQDGYPQHDGTWHQHSGQQLQHARGHQQLRWQLLSLFKLEWELLLRERQWQHLPSQREWRKHLHPRRQMIPGVHGAHVNADRFTCNVLHWGQPYMARAHVCLHYSTRRPRFSQ